MIGRPVLPRAVAALILVLLLAGAVAVLAQEVEEMPPEAAAAVGIGMIVGGLAFLVYLVITIVIIVFLYKDAQARSQQGALWAILGFLFSWVALIVWLIIRPKE